MELSDWPLVVERGLRATDAIAVTSWPQELVFVHSQRCPCGGRFEQLDHALVSATRERWRVRCHGCDRVRPFWFDVSSFEGQPWAQGRFEEVRRLFSDALERVSEGDIEGARVRFSEVASREPWFGLAWYHLGMIAMIQDQPALARCCLETAAGILPLDPEIRGSLADYWDQEGDPVRAGRCRAAEAALRDGIG
ncbi:MAG: hypothetical protein GY913_19725 [Proteobacteria bacterium]|nr:hypothetical protein [Pseudomonadota bacterium]MCP4919138.1 hypothetical protein [Pseudomonadota bacterium]